MDKVENRRLIRRIVAIPARLEGLGPMRPVLLRNLSENGCSFTRPKEAALGSAITLHLTDCPPIEAWVVWISDGFAGCRFRGWLAPEAVNALSRRNEAPYLEMREGSPKQENRKAAGG